MTYQLQEAMNRLKELIKPVGVFGEVISSYISDTCEEVYRLQLVAADGDFEKIEAIAHQLKSGFQLLNSFTLWEMCRELEECSEFSSKTNIVNSCLKISDEWLVLKSDMELFVENCLS